MLHAENEKIYFFPVKIRTQYQHKKFSQKYCLMGREGGHELYLSISFDFAYYSTGFLSSVKRLWPFNQQKSILGC